MRFGGYIGVGVQIPWTGLKGEPDSYALSRHSSQQGLGSEHVGGDMEHG